MVTYNTVHSKHGYIFSTGNNKMGKVLSFSIPPIITCHPDAPCTKRDGKKFSKCYADKLQILRPSLAKSWENNLDLLMKDNEYENFIEDTVSVITFVDPVMFRWHVGGDIFELGYLNAMLEIAESCPAVKFWAFTKRFDTVSEWLEMYPNGKFPTNFNLILSVWPPHMPDQSLMDRFGTCWFQNSQMEIDVPDYAVECNDNCETCMKCSELKAGEAIYIMEH